MEASLLWSRPRAVGRDKLPASLLLLLLGRHRADVHAFALAPLPPSAAITSVSSSSFIGAPDLRVAALSRAPKAFPVYRCRSREQPRRPSDNRCSCRCSSEVDHVSSWSKQGFAISSSTTTSSRSSSNNNRRRIFARSRTKLLAEPEESQGVPSGEAGTLAGEGQAAQGAASDDEVVEKALGDGGGGLQQQQQQLPEVVNPFKLAFDAGRNLRATLAKNLEQITGTASPVSLRFCAFCSAVFGEQEAHDSLNNWVTCVLCEGHN